MIYSADGVAKRKVQTGNTLPKFVPWLKTADPDQEVFKNINRHTQYNYVNAMLSSIYSNQTNVTTVPSNNNRLLSTTKPHFYCSTNDRWMT